MSFKSRPNKLCEIVQGLNDKQRDAVKHIGFGGLLHMKGLGGVMPWKHFDWYFRNFDVCRRVIRFSNGRDVVITPEHMKDLFLLPNCDKSFVLLNDKRNKEDMDYVEEFRKDFKLSASARHSTLVGLLKNSRFEDGGDDFKRIFVLFSMSSYLAATTNMQIDYSILKSLKDVNKISSFNWCEFILERMCRGLRSYPKANISGCVMAIPLLYFHMCTWQGREEPCTIPLIQHWTTEKIKSRSLKEVSGVASFGVGKWVKGIYPISSVTYVEMGEDDSCQRRGSGADKRKRKDKEVADDVDEEDGWIKFKLPSTVKTKKEIEEVANNDLHRSVLLFERDLSVITEHYFGTMRRMKESFESLGKMDGPSTSSSRSNASIQDEDALDKEFAQFFDNPDFFNKLDLLEKLFFPKKQSTSGICTE